MNKLFVVRFILRGYNLATFNFWNQDEAIRKMQEHPDWKFKEIEDNEIHTIWEGR